MTLFQRCNNVVDVQTTLYQRQNDVVSTSKRRCVRREFKRIPNGFLQDHLLSPEIALIYREHFPNTILLEF